MATHTDATLNGWDLEAFRETVATVESNPEAGPSPGAAGGMGRALRARRAHRSDRAARPGHPKALHAPRRPPAGAPRREHGSDCRRDAAGGTRICIAGTYAAHATAQGVALDALEVSVESGSTLTDSSSSGRRTQASTASASPSRPLGRRSRDARGDRKIVTKASPVYDSVARPVAIESAVERI